ncbi:MAG: YdeI/OmpD-associated family protein [Terracidiphilus sp.]
MPASPKKTFTAVLEPDGTSLRWVVARIPFDVARTWPERRRLRVRGEIEGFAFRTSLFRDPRGEGHILLVNKKMQAGAGAGVGAAVRIRIEPDLEERETVIPPELVRAMKADRRLAPYLGAMPPSHQREIGKWVAEPKSAETRVKRAEAMAERLLFALEGETETPPVLEAAFRRQPLARTGWEAMTPNQRRGHLLGISYYGTAEARERRAAKAVEEALKAARRAAPRGE